MRAQYSLDKWWYNVRNKYKFSIKQQTVRLTWIKCKKIEKKLNQTAVKKLN